MSSSPNKSKKHTPKWRSLFDLTVLSAFFYAAMEWLFFATKPSSLSLLSTPDLINVLFVTGGTVALIGIALLIVLSLPAFITHRPRLFAIAYIVPALILSVTALIMYDNFTYTVFKYGIVSTQGIRRGIYALGFLLFLWRMIVFTQRTVRKRHKFASFLTVGMLAVSMTGILITKFSNDPSLGNLDSNLLSQTSTRHPNIIILGTDGLSDSYLSAYGARQQTTPFLSQLMKTSLVAENAFPNASSTTGSTTSALTGREPITDQVFRYPDILSGRASFEHLPGILKQHGYETAEFGTPYYVDARKLNLINGFDIVNNQSSRQPLLDLLRTVLSNSPSTYFIQTIAERADERLLHIFYIRKMKNPLEEVYNPGARIPDDQEIDQMIDLLNKANSPVFIFAHLMDTHGPDFSFRKQVFSDPASANTSWNFNRYLDAILSYDGHLKKLYDYLSQSGKLDNTILVVYTDHGFKYAINQRIPIVIHFPQNAYAGPRQNNIQIIDIPVTLLNYLGIPAPSWMTGTSLLKGETPPLREIITTTSGSPKEIAPPFYQINNVQVIVCQKWYELDVRENVFNSGTITGHTTRCNNDQLPTEDKIHQKILTYLADHGYDISSLK